MSAPVFSPQSIQKIVDETIAPEAPSDARYAIVATVDEDGAKVAVRFRKAADTGFAWELQGVFGHEWAGDTQVGAKLIMSW